MSSLPKHSPRASTLSQQQALRASRSAISVVLIVVAFTAPSAMAQLSERFGPYELHFSVVNTTFIEPEVAAQYGLARGKRRAILNLSLREHLEDGNTVAREMDLKGLSWDLTERQDFFDFIQVIEGPAIYYIGEFKFLNREWRYFEVDFQPENDGETFNYKFKHQMWVND
ncbi:MAG: DUF4426 domain-containing protein [Pseudomonadota bacterium]